MSFQPSFPGLLSTPPPAVPEIKPATDKQIQYARQIAARLGEPMPAHLAQDRAKLSDWINASKQQAPEGRFSNYPSSKQVAFAERIARIKRQDIPRECFRDKRMMSKWIDHNKPH